MSADAAIGELDLNGHAGDGGRSAMQGLAGGVTDEREAARQHAAIGERREQLRIALAAGEPRGDQRAHGALGALRKHDDALVLARDPRAIGLDIRRHAGAQPVCDAGIALAPALDIGAQQLRAQTAADARKTDAMNLRIGAQCASKRGASMIPLISAVGHETDVTLIDFAADRRAPTPTAAAEMAVPVRADLLVAIDSLARRALACWRRNQEARRTELRSAARALPDADEVLAVPRQRLDHAAAALARALRANAQIHRVGFSRIGGRLSPQLLRTNVERRRERYTGIAHRLRASVAANIETCRTRIARQRDRVGVFAQRGERAVRTLIAARLARCERDAQLLAAFSYRGVLARGFALIRDAAGQPLHSAMAITAGMPIEIEFSDGRVGARADGAPSADTPDAKPRAKRGGGVGQGDLF